MKRTRKSKRVAVELVGGGPADGTIMKLPRDSTCVDVRTNVRIHSYHILHNCNDGRSIAIWEGYACGTDSA